MDFKKERLLWQKNYRNVIGIDESGVGPLAGPVVAVAVRYDPLVRLNEKLKLVQDSKKLTESKREALFQFLVNNPNITYSIANVYPKTIDKINIYQATRLAMKRAANKLINIDSRERIFLLIDGKIRIEGTNCKQESIVKGDEKIISIASASIIAKVTRDRIMRRMHMKYPDYNFSKHKGYGTKEHMSAILDFGVCPTHRRSFVK